MMKSIEKLAVCFAIVVACSIFAPTPINCLFADEPLPIPEAEIEEVPRFPLEEIIERPSPISPERLRRTTGTATASDATGSDIPAVNRASLEALVERLKRDRAELQADLDKLKGIRPRNEDEQPREPVVLELMRSKIEEAESHQAKRMTDLRRQIYKLQGLIERERTKPAPALTPKTDNAASRDSASQIIEPPVAKAEPQTPARPTIKFPTIPTRQPGEFAEPIPVPVTSGPVDRLRLADNLFATGEPQLALEIYEDIIELRQAPAKQTWIEYQMAGCHRQLGDLDQAERLYRVVTGTPNAEFLSQSSRWWLESIKRQREIQARHNQLTKTVQTIDENIDETEQR